MPTSQSIHQVQRETVTTLNRSPDKPGIILCCDSLHLITLQQDKRGFLIKESTLQSAKDMHPTLINHISAKIIDIRLILSQDGELTKALQLYNDFWPKHNTKFFPQNDSDLIVPKLWTASIANGNVKVILIKK